VESNFDSPKGTESHIVVYRPVGETSFTFPAPVRLTTPATTARFAVHNPAALFSGLFKDALAQRGIGCNRPDAGDRLKYREVHRFDLTKLIELGSVESMPLGT